MIDIARIEKLHAEYRAARVPLEERVRKYDCSLFMTDTGDLMVVCRRGTIPAFEWLAIPEGSPGVERAKNDVHRQTGVAWDGRHNSDPNITHDGLSTCSDDCR